MKNLALALVAALAASCSSPDGPATFPGYKESDPPTRSFTLDVPPGCNLWGVKPGYSVATALRECSFATGAGHERTIEIHQTIWSPDAPLGAAERAALRQDPERFRARAMGWQVQPESGPRQPVPGANDCTRFSHTVTDLQTHAYTGDVQGIRCTFFDPATDTVEEFRLTYADHHPGADPDPRFAADAERLIGSLSFPQG